MFLYVLDFSNFIFEVVLKKRVTRAGGVA